MSPSDEQRDDPRSDRVRIRLPTGEYEWVTPEAFNLISEREFLDSDQLRRLRRQRNVAVAVAALTAIVLAVGGLVFLTAGRSEPAPGGGGESVAVPGGATAERPAPTTSAPPSAEPAAGGAASTDEEIAATVRAWVRAWSAQDVESYLGFYSASFRPPEGMSRSAWEGLRRERIERPESITIAVSDVETARTGETTAIARFTQGYRSPGYRDWVAKTLELTLESGRWRITDERSSLIEAGSTLSASEPSQ